MKAIKITLLFLIFCFSAFAKDSTTVEFKKFALGIHGSPDYSYRNSYSYIHSTEALNNFEKPMLAYTGGADISYFFKQRFAISLGVDYIQKGFRTKELTVTTVEQPEGEIGTGRNRYNYNYIGIPIKLHFVAGKRKIRFIISQGFTPAFLLYERTNFKIKYNDGSRETKRGKLNYIFTPFNLFHEIGLGINCQLGKRAGLIIEPTYIHGLFDTGRSVRYTENLYSYSLNIGCYIKL